MEEDLSKNVLQAFRILDALRGRGVEYGVSDLARRLGLAKSSTFRLLRTLEYVGAVRCDPASQKYGIQAGGVLAGGTVPGDVVSSFQRAASRVNRRLDLTIQLGVLVGTNVVFVSYVETTQAVRLVAYTGRTLPAHASALGKAMLAELGDEGVALVETSELRQLTSSTIMDREILLAELVAARELGYATEEEESTANLSCVGISVAIPERSVGPVGLSACLPMAQLPTDIGGIVDGLREIRREMVEGTGSELADDELERA